MSEVHYNINEIADVHNHILCGIDDGAADAKISAAMLGEQYKIGVRSVIATPHYDVTMESPDSFLARRRGAERQVAELCRQSECPKIYVGAEVAFVDGISNIGDLHKLCIEGTDFLLLELPFARWQNSVANEIKTIISLGITPILAHTERYLKFMPKRIWEEFAAEGAYLQCNADYFKEHPYLSAKRANKGLIHLIGSDCHNMANRKPNLSEGLEAAEKYCGEDFFGELAKNSAAVLENATAINA